MKTKRININPGVNDRRDPYLALDCNVAPGVLIFITGILALLWISGCARVPASPDRVASESQQPLNTDAVNASHVLSADRCLNQASLLGQQDEYQMALFYLQLAQALRPGDTAIAAEIKRIQTLCHQKAEEHFRQGVVQYGQKHFDQARRHFLIVLRYDPGNSEALRYIKQRLIPTNYRSYKVKPGDNLKQIAKKVYQDPGKDFLIAYFNDLKTDQLPKPGCWLRVPHLEAEFAKPFFDIKGELARAQNSFAEERYGDVVGITSKILAYDYLNEEAQALSDKAYFQMGLHLLDQNKYEAAMHMLNKVSEDFPGLVAALQDAHAQEIKRAEMHLQKKEYAEALTAAKRVREYDPVNPAVDELINRIFCAQGKALAQQAKYIEAMRTLAQADANDGCIVETKAAIKNQLKKQAESHYLKGVKYFLREDLQQAINEWEMAVELDPEHQKARSGIRNARHLMEQLEKVD